MHHGLVGDTTTIILLLGQEKVLFVKCIAIYFGFDDLGYPLSFVDKPPCYHDVQAED